ncbi:hypothetical protein AURDEDRAFT_59336 [Auricularia subglabra TFB-10046 SS5]|nr:hypothetical protein AURDEDRAFT_59336 [Auricularia subglabra TFB-10046 SS5]
MQTDVSRPAALARATLGPSAHAQQKALLEQPSDAYLDAIEEDFNRRLDGDVEVLVEGMGDLVALAAVGDKDKFVVAQEAFQAQCRAESMVRAANSLLSLTHTLKLMLLLADEQQIVKQRTEERAQVREEADGYKTRAAELADGLLGEEIFQPAAESQPQV